MSKTTTSSKVDSYSRHPEKEGDSSADGGSPKGLILAVLSVLAAGALFSMRRKTYTVRYGDNLTQVAKRMYGRSPKAVDKLLSRNPSISDRNKIYADQKIQL